MGLELHQGDLFWVNTSFKSKGLHNNPGSDVGLEEAGWGGLHWHVARVPFCQQPPKHIWNFIKCNIIACIIKCENVYYRAIPARTWALF